MSRTPKTSNLTDRPLAASGLTSYRLRGPYGYIMIGARDHDDAMREAARSTSNPKRAALEVWNGDRYVKAFGSGRTTHSTRKPPAQLDREIDEAIGGRFGPAIKACARLGLDTTASQLAHCVQNAVGPGVPAVEVQRAVAVAWRNREKKRA